MSDPRLAAASLVALRETVARFRKETFVSAEACEECLRPLVERLAVLDAAMAPQLPLLAE